ncbi:hypothetical protein GLOIN_2v1774047 [Rhizophagus clarus]|uniref:Uncharacterized protein n=1 Tax=Rhizophagus clarus TaxID=94130 RepID=A0A8H3M3E5_9GLOM|nr:hypothetical protein GLOIN_2v1774047 [Rhizophagus clarus]
MHVNPESELRHGGVRLQKRWKELDLDNELLEVNDLDELEEYEKKEIKNNKSSYFKASHQSKNLINKEFEHLGEIKGQEKSEKDLEFRKQKELGAVIKRRAIAIHHAKVPKSHPNNGSDI